MLCKFYTVEEVSEMHLGVIHHCIFWIFDVTFYFFLYFVGHRSCAHG